MMLLPGMVALTCVFRGVIYEHVALVHMRRVVCHPPLQWRDIEHGFSVCDDCPIEAITS